MSGTKISDRKCTRIEIYYSKLKCDCVMFIFVIAAVIGLTIAHG